MNFNNGRKIIIYALIFIIRNIHDCCFNIISISHCFLIRLHRKSISNYNSSAEK